MIKNFDKVKLQLNELADVLNKFNSEAVQLKVVELLLGGAEKETTIAKPEKATEAAEAVTTEKRRRPGRPPKKAKEETKPKERAPRKRISDRPGPSTILKQLMETDFFSEKRTIGDIVNYCQDKFNYTYKSTDLSGTLAKFAKDGVLSREKNPDTNQFEYMKP